MVILMDGGGKFLAHIKSLPISDRIKLADAFVQQIQDKKVLLNKALQRANDNGMSIPSLNCGVLTMALLHDQLAALVWAANNECILDVVYRRFGLTPDFLFITANDLRQFLTISTALTDDILEERAAALNTLFQNIPENQRQAFLEKALMGDLGQAARALSDNDLKLAWFEDMLASYDPNLPGGQQLVDAFVGKPELVGAWEVLHSVGTPLKTDVTILTRILDDFVNIDGFEAFLKANPNKVDEWLEFDDFFMTRDDNYWNKFNVPPNVLVQTRTRALRALQEYPHQYVEALEDFGLSKSDLYTRHGVDYGAEFFQAIADFKVNNSSGLTDAEIYAIFGYTSNFFYWDLNNWLRQGVNQSKTQAISDIIASGLNKLPSWSGNIAYRGIKIKPPNIQSQIDNILARYPINENIPHGEFISVGSNPSASFLDNPNVKIRIEFDLKPNSTAKDISALADGILYRGSPASELLFPPNVSFHVDKISPPDVDGIITMFLTEL